jgi:predicted CxxxxCH...CXXCH cytochrome family protein
MDGTIQVSLFEASVPATSLKARNAATAAFDPTARTCSGVYCHSSGQDVGTAFATTPAWDSTAKLGCGGCHGNPPRYPTGGAGAASANSHISVTTDPDGDWVGGHFGGVGGNSHAGQHGESATLDEATISCQTCHFDTTDATNTGPAGFYYLDTSGDYVFPGAVNEWVTPLVCNSCHTGAGALKQQGGKVLPLRHVNGARDVVFDPRDALPQSIPYLPATPNKPAKPYWRTDFANSMNAWTTATRNGTTGSISVGASQYDSSTKTCTSVACHAGGSLPLRWGDPVNWDCRKCHY